MEYGLVALWLAAYLIVGLATLPLAAAIFPRFHDAGAAFAIPIGLTILTVVGFLLGHLTMGWPTLIVALGIIVVASATVGQPGAVNERAYGEVAVVFTLAFLFIVALRGATPAIAPLPLATGEKFLDFGLLRTILRAGSLPPEDMWFAGESVQYYYGGYLLTALLTVLTGTAPEFAYNLALAGFYAALVTAAYGLAGAIADSHTAPTRLAAGLAAFFVGIAANLRTAGQVLLWLIPDSLITTLTGIEPGADILTWTPRDFWYWPASRVLEGTINPFPLFSWLNGDLHPHQMSTPFVVLTAALCYSYWQTPPEERTRRRLVLLAAIPVIGVLAITNTWDVPIAGGVLVLTLTFAPSDPASVLPATLWEHIPPREGLTEEVRRIILALGGSILLLGVAAILVAPFWFESASQRAIGIFPPRSNMGPLLLVHGGFLLIFIPYLVGRASDPLLALGVRQPRAYAWIAIAVGIGLAVWLAGFPAVTVFGPLLAVAWLVLRRQNDVGFESLLMLAGFGLILIVEFIYVIEPLYQGTTLERYNTVFKVYMQLQVLWAPAAGVALARLLDPSHARPSVNTPEWRAVGAAIGIVVLLTTGLYAGFAVPTHLDAEPEGSNDTTLNGTAYLSTQYPQETAAIRWLDDQRGQPTIVTAAPGGYWWQPAEGDGASAPSSLTGIPTVLGWFHEEQYRGEDAYQQRLRDVTTIYEGTTEEQTALLTTYDVEYVYVGPAERNAYAVTIEDHPSLEVAFQDETVVIYAVTE